MILLLLHITVGCFVCSPFVFACVACLLVCSCVCRRPWAPTNCSAVAPHMTYVLYAIHSWFVFVAHFFLVAHLSLCFCVWCITCRLVCVAGPEIPRTDVLCVSQGLRSHELKCACPARRVRLTCWLAKSPCRLGSTKSSSGYYIVFIGYYIVYIGYYIVYGYNIVYIGYYIVYIILCLAAWAVPSQVLGAILCI